MATYVLVHGAWHGAWCWDKVAPILEQHGHRVLAPDLPGHGTDRTPFEQRSFGAYVQRVADLVAAEIEPVILVGHSLGGTVISAATERHPEKVRLLVYVAAFLLQDGQSRLDLGPGDPPSAVAQFIVSNSDEGWCRIPGPAVREVFCADCSEADIATVAARLVEEPLSWVAARIDISSERFGRIPRVYVECRQDRAIPLSQQRHMYESMPCERIISMDTSHSPYLSDPETLAAHLRSLA